LSRRQVTKGQRRKRRIFSFAFDVFSFGIFSRPSWTKQKKAEKNAEIVKRFCQKQDFVDLSRLFGSWIWALLSFSRHGVGHISNKINFYQIKNKFSFLSPRHANDFGFELLYLEISIRTRQYSGAQCSVLFVFVRKINCPRK